jgi:hypothetical protein
MPSKSWICRKVNKKDLKFEYMCLAFFQEFYGLRFIVIWNGKIFLGGQSWVKHYIRASCMSLIESFENEWEII